MALVLVTRSTNAPATPYDGQMWIDTTGVPAAKVYDKGNTTWVTLDAADADLVEADYVADLSVVLAQGDVDDAGAINGTEIAAYFNTQNAVTNAILAALQANGMMATS